MRKSPEILKIPAALAVLQVPPSLGRFHKKATRTLPLPNCAGRLQILTPRTLN
jgi:hypothetical protein